MARLCPLTGLLQRSRAKLQTDILCLYAISRVTIERKAFVVLVEDDSIKQPALGYCKERLLHSETARRPPCTGQKHY